MGIRKMGRDESMMEYAMKLLIQVLINFSMGMIGKWNITISMYKTDAIVNFMDIIDCMNKRTVNRQNSNVSIINHLKVLSLFLCLVSGAS